MYIRIMNVGLIDTHAHLDRFITNGEISKLISDARAAGVEKIITQSASFDDWTKYKDLASTHENIYWAVGLHPEDITQYSSLQLDALGSFFAEDAPARPVAIGEIGLDFFRKDSWTENPDDVVMRQSEIFERQLYFAKQFGCPVVIHARSANRECLDTLHRVGMDFSKVVFHCFSGSLSELDELISEGGRASFTGIITYKNASEMRECMLAQGVERVMFETDCPYLSPEPLRGSVNVPANLRLTVEYAAREVFKIPFEELARISSANAEEFFGI